MVPGLRASGGGTYAQMLLALNGLNCDLQIYGGIKKGLVEVKKEQNHYSMVTYAGINWGG
jgi:hypothetical protein